MKKILITVPCLYNAHVCHDAITSILNRVNIDVLIGDNGADQDVKEVIEKFKDYSNVKVIHEPINTYVNPIWNKFIKYFLDHPKYDHIILYNSDLIMNHYFHQVLENIWEKFPELILVPTLTDKNSLKSKVNINTHTFTVVQEGIQGVFITLSRKQAELVHPIPSEIKLWFGDTYLYTLLNDIVGPGSICIVDSLLAHHIGSETIKRLPELQEILTEDKIAWNTKLKAELEKRIQKIKNLQ